MAWIKAGFDSRWVHKSSHQISGGLRIKSMKKIWGWIVGVALVIAVGFYIIWNGSRTTPVATTTGTPATPTLIPAPSGGYKDGIYTGSVADAIYGKLQVVVTISGGKITDVSFPVYPNNPGHSSQVSAFALPQLKQEAIASQSANVNIVSGATQTSQAFQQSLAAALAQAGS